MLLSPVLLVAGLGCSSCSSTKGVPDSNDLGSADSGSAPGHQVNTPDSAAETGRESGGDTTGDSGGDSGQAPCPAVPADAVTVTLPEGYGHPTAVLLTSGQVAIFEVYLADTYDSEQLTFGESAGAAYSPNPVAIEFSISRCPGEVLPYDATDFCTYYTTNGSYNSILYLGYPHDTLVDAASAATYGYCWAPMDDGPWYLNMRWTYSECAYGASACGFMLQRNMGPW